MITDIFPLSAKKQYITAINIIIVALSKRYLRNVLRCHSSKKAQMLN
jgi:hypothetical protein